jgi:hypothetical protein
MSKNKKKLTEEQAIEKLAGILDGEGIQEVKQEIKEEVKKEEVPKEEKKEIKEEDKPKEEEKKKNSPIGKVKNLKKKEKRTKRDDIYDLVKIALEEKYGKVRMSKEGWAFEVEEEGEMKWHCVRVIAKKAQPEFK